MANTDKKIVIVAPNFPPSGLTAVHRNRFLATHLKKFGWEPTILTVKSEYYKERLDYDLQKVVPENLKIIRTVAFKPGRLVGDTAIRCFLWHWDTLRRLAKKKQIDFLFISLFPAMSTLLGRLIYEEFKVPYGIDFQDPWVKESYDKKPLFSKAWLAKELAKVLEPFAVKKASMIMSVADSYIQGVISRNPHLNKIKKVIAPIGFEPQDHKVINHLNKKAYIFKKEEGLFNFIYAGAALPKAYTVLKALFAGLKKLEKENLGLFKKIKIYFIGTGKSPDDPTAFNVRPIAEEFDLYNTTIVEYPARIPYLDVLVHLKEADAILIIGSTEKHYTASKIFQAVFSKKPILALLHEKSTAVQLLKKSNAGKTISFKGEANLDNIAFKACNAIKEVMIERFDENKVNYSYFNDFTAAAQAKKLAETLDAIVGR